MQVLANQRLEPGQEHRLALRGTLGRDTRRSR
jgi:hypothetical protein